MSARMQGATLVLAGRTGQLLLPLFGAVLGSSIPSNASEADVYQAAGGARVLMVHPDGARWLSPYWNAADADGHLRWRFDLDGEAGKLTVLILGRDREGLSGPWAHARTSDELYRGLSVYQRTVGTPWYDSVGRTAERLILSTHPREKGGLTLDREADVPLVMEGSQVESAWLDWRRPLIDGELALSVAGGGVWVHSYDANAQYLSAWTADLGVGECVAGPRTFDKSVPGYWQVPELLELGTNLLHPEGDHLNPALLPLPWLHGREWFTTPTLTRYVESTGGHVPLVVDAYTWPRKSRYLNGAYEILRDARAALLAEQADPAGRLALNAVKALYRVETGRLGMASRGDHGWKRPDWADTIRATARVNLHRRLAGSPTRAPLAAAPFAIATDGLLFLAPAQLGDGLDYAAQLGLPVGTGLGQFSHEGSVWVEDGSDLLAHLVEARSAAATFKLLRQALA